MGEVEDHFILFSQTLFV